MTKFYNFKSIAFDLLLYCLCTSTLLIVNKVLVEAFEDALLISLVQNTISLAVIEATHSRSGLAIRDQLRTLTFNKVKQWSSVVLWFVAMQVTALHSLHSTSVATVIVIRNLTSLVVALVESPIFPF